MRRIAILASFVAALGIASAASAQQTGTITGTVKYSGKAPITDQELVVGSDGGVQYAVVSIPDAKGTAKAGEAIKFDQKGCQYQPHVLAFPAGSHIQVLNSDGILHNIHTESTKNPAVN